MTAGDRVTAAPLSARLGDTELRDVRLGAETVLDRLYFAIRDPDWGTLDLRVLERAERSIPGGRQLAVRGTTTDGAIDFRLEFDLCSDSLEARMQCDAHADTRINRIGFCLLHPMRAAGSRLAVTTPGGRVETVFPERIAARSPATDVQQLETMADGRRLTIAFTGELFEIEDQRNWIDPSFKTFSTPLSHRRPRPIATGDRLDQAVRMTWSPSTARPSDAASARVAPAPARRPQIGLGASTSWANLHHADLARLRVLNPAWLAVTLQLDGDWRPSWERAIDEATALGVPLDISLVTSASKTIETWRPEPLPDAVVRVHAYDRVTHATTRELAASACHAIERLGWSHTRVAGGSRANFAELNRADLPLDLLDEVVFAANPQVHAFDDESIMATPPALGAAVRDAIEIAQGRPVVVAPLSLRPLFNAVALDPSSEQGVDADPRQHGPLAAAWMLSAIHSAGAASGITLFETTGPRGLIDDQGVASPAYSELL